MYQEEGDNVSMDSPLSLNKVFVATSYADCFTSVWLVYKLREIY